MKKYTILFCLLICLVVVGCSRNKTLTGKVTFTDGKPATCGIVIFQTDNFISKGEIMSDGSYTMSSAKENDGIPPGDYKVYVSGITKTGKGSATLLPVPLCAPKFEKPHTSGLTCTIPAPENKFDIVLEPHPKNYP